MYKNIKKISALILSIIFMTESVSAASLGDMLKSAGTFLSETADFLLPDIITSDAAISDGAIADDVVSSQAVDAEDILNSYGSYSQLDNIEKRILNYELGVRSDTMELLDEKGYSLRASVPYALIMQRMDFSVSQAEETYEKLGKEQALSQSLKFRELELAYGGWEENESTAENIAELMADGYNENEAIGLFVMSESLNMPVDDIKAIQGSVTENKPAEEISSEVLTEIVSEGLSEADTQSVQETSTETAAEVSTENIEIVTGAVTAEEPTLYESSVENEAVMYNGAEESKQTDEISLSGAETDTDTDKITVDDNIITETSNSDEVQAETPAEELPAEVLSDTSNVLNEESLADIADMYGINESVLIDYAQDNSLNLDTIEDNIVAKTEELGLSTAVSAYATSDDDDEGDENKLKGPFVAASGINDSINYTTGAIMYDENILSLPGANGLDLNISLHYDSSKRFRDDDGGDEVFKHDNEVWELGFTRLTNKYGGDVGGDYRNKLTNIRLSDGSVYELAGTGKGYWVLKQDAFDTIKIYEDTSASFVNNSGISASYYAEYLDGTREYFTGSGNYVGTTDRFNNKIVLSSSGNVTTVTDSAGRTVTITYAESGDKKTMTVKAPDQSQIVLTFGKASLNLRNSKYLWKLEEKKQVVDGKTLTTKYEYIYGEYYTPRGAVGNSHDEYKEVLLNKVTYPTGMTLNYEYDEDERGKINGWDDTNGSWKNHCTYGRITRRYYVVDGKVYNDTHYDYTETNYTKYQPWIYDDDFDEVYDEIYDEDEYIFGMTVEEDNGLHTEYTFDNKLFNTSVRAWYNFSGSSKKEVYLKKLSYETSVGDELKEYENGDVKIYNPNPTWITLTTEGRTKIEHYEYNSNGLVSAYFSPLAEGNSKNYEYRTSYSYNKYGLVASKSYKQNASTVVVESNAFSTDQCSITESSVKVNDVVKAKTQYSAFNDYGNPETVKEYIQGNNCITTTYAYNDTNGYKGLLTSSTKDGVTVSYEYDIMGRNTKQTNGKNGVTTYTYDTMGSLTSATSPKGNKETYKYDYQANTIQYTDAKGNVTSYDYDPAGNLLTVKSGNDTLAAYTYDNSMMCVSEKVGDSLTKYSYDHLYRLGSMTVRDAADTKTYKKETYTYDGSDLSTPTTTTITLSEGTGSSLKNVIEDSTVNDCGWITEKYDYSKGLNGTKPIYKYEYDYLGNPIKVMVNTASTNTTDGPYAATTYEYDYAGRVTKETDSLGGVKEYTYDQLGRKTAEKDKNGNTSTFTYDAYNRLTLSSAPLEGSSYMKQRYTYDANGNVIKEETLNSAVGASESWAVTNYTYDADNNLTRAESIDTDSKKYYTTYGYDANGNTTRVTSANGKNATNYVYDKYNRVTKMTDPMGYVETYTYDIAGNMLSKTDRNGNKIQYTYDPANRLTKEYSGNTVRAEYTYDLAGNKIQETNSNITVKSTYNQQNRLSKVNITKPGENNINYDILYGYDARGNVNYRAVWKNNTGNRLDNNYIQQYYYTYDNNNNMTAVKSNNTSSATVYASYTYDANGNVLLEKFNNGVSTGYKYNKANLPVYIGTGNNKGQDQTCYRMEYYLDGNLKKNVSGLIGHVEMTLEYTYDGLGRLKTESNKMGSLSDLVTYTYDDAGNRSKVTAAGSRNNYTTEYIYDKNNRLVREVKATSGKTIADVTRYTYDKNGNTLVKKQGTQYNDMYTINYRGAFGIYLDTEDMPYSYEKNTYDVFNRLVSTTDEAGNKSTYTYYPSNLRLSKQVANGSNTTYTGFMWDGSQIVTEFDNDFNITNHYLFGRGQRRISGTNDITNKQTYYIYNVHGDVEALADAGGVVTKTYRYDAFGNEENETAGDTNPFRYCGEYYDAETGNIYLRNRYYNPSTGTFITEDPARDGGNWYSYCDGNPVMYIDPSGYEKGLARQFAYDIAPLFAVNDGEWDTSENGIATLTLGWGDDTVVRDYNYASGMAYIPNDNSYKNIVSINSQGHMEMERTDFYDSIGLNYVKYQVKFTMTKAGEISQIVLYTAVGTAIGASISSTAVGKSIGAVVGEIGSNVILGEIQSDLILEEGTYLSEIILCDRPVDKDGKTYENVQTTRVLKYATDINTGESVPVEVISDYRTVYTGLTSESEVNRIKK